MGKVRLNNSRTGATEYYHCASQPEHLTCFHFFFLLKNTQGTDKGFDLLRSKHVSQINLWSYNNETVFFLHWP